MTWPEPEPEAETEGRARPKLFGVVGAGVESVTEALGGAGEVEEDGEADDIGPEGGRERENEFGGRAKGS